MRYTDAGLFAPHTTGLEQSDVYTEALGRVYHPKYRRGMERCAPRYAATVLADYYQATGRIEYMERAVAAARSTFAVAPWENWAHTGYPDQPGALTGFHWGTGSAMTTVEMLSPVLGDALIDMKAERSVGFDECTITDVEVQGNEISFHLSFPSKQRHFLVRFRGVQPSRQYRVRWNRSESRSVSGDQLLNSGLEVGPLE